MRRSPDLTRAATLPGKRRAGTVDVPPEQAREPGRATVTDVATGGQVRGPRVGTSVPHNPWWQEDGIDRVNGGEHVAQFYDAVAEEYEPLVFAAPNRPLIPRVPPDTWDSPLWESIVDDVAEAPEDDS